MNITGRQPYRLVGLPGYDSRTWANCQLIDGGPKANWVRFCFHFSEISPSPGLIDVSEPARQMRTNPCAHPMITLAHGSESHWLDASDPARFLRWWEEACKRLCGLGPEWFCPMNEPDLNQPTSVPPSVTMAYQSYLRETDGDMRRERQRHAYEVLHDWELELLYVAARAAQSHGVKLAGLDWMPWPVGLDSAWLAPRLHGLLDGISYHIGLGADFDHAEHRRILAAMKRLYPGKPLIVNEWYVDNGVPTPASVTQFVEDFQAAGGICLIPQAVFNTGGPGSQSGFNSQWQPTPQTKAWLVAGRT